MEDNEGKSGTNARGIYVKWYGEVKCLRGTLNSDGEFEYEFPDGECSSWGALKDNFKKRVFCRQYQYRNCYDHDIGDSGPGSINVFHSVPKKSSKKFWGDNFFILIFFSSKFVRIF